MIVVIAFILAAVAMMALAAAFAAIVLGIQLAERRKSLPGPSRGCADALARRVLRADVGPQAAGQRCSRGRDGSRGRKAARHAR